jgi:hypothetical protein
MVPMFNLSYRKVGGIRFVKLGRFCFSFCVCREYKPLKEPFRSDAYFSSLKMLAAIERELKS